MATQGNNTKTVVIDFKVLPGDAVKTIQDTQKKIENLKVTMKGMKDAGLENTETYIKLQAAMKDMQQVVRSNQKVLLDSIKEQKAEGDSLNALRAQLRGLREEYENLSKAERESAQGNELLGKITDVTNEVKGLEYSLQDYTRNVGNYWSALEGFPGGKLIMLFRSLGAGTMSLSQVFKMAGQSVKVFAKELWALMSNPIVAAIAAIAAVVMKLVDSFKKNDQAMTELQRTFAAFKPVLDLIERGFQAIVNVVTKVVGAIGNGVRTLMSWIPGLRDYVQAEDDIVVATDNLEEAERQYTVNSAKRQAEISELRNKSVQSDKYTFEERKKFLEQALQLEQDELKEKQDIAEEKLRIAREEAATEIGYAHYSQEAYENMTDEAKNRLAELEAAVINATTEFNNGTRRMQSSLSSFTKQEESEQKQRVKSAASARKERLKNEREAVDALQKMWINGIRNLQDKEYALTAQEGKKQIDQLKNRLNEEKNLTKTAKEAINRQIVLLEADLQLKLGDLRKKYQQDELEKQLEQSRTYYQKVLEGLKDEDIDAQVAVQLVLNDLDTELLKRSSEIALNEVKEVWKSAQKELEDFESGNISVDEITTKYKDVWELNGINLGNALANMKALVLKYDKDVEDEVARHTNYLNAIEKAGEEEKLRIRLEGTRKLHDEETKRIDLSRKHAEILRQITLSENYDEYGRNEMEKTRIMLEQAQERVKIAQEEYSRLAGERQKYNDEELKAIYGSVDEYNNILLEAQLKVVESENAVKDAVKAVSDEAINQKKTMIGLATSMMQSMGAILGSMQGLFDQLAESDEKYQKYANALAFVDIMTNMAVGIAEAVSAGAGMPFPYNLAAIAAGVAAVVAGITEAIVLFKKNDKVESSPKFAKGGLVKGPGTGTSDSVDIKASSGEYIIRQKIVEKYGVDFFDSLNSDGLLKKLEFSGLKFASGGVVPNMTNITTTAIDYDMMREVMRESMGEALSEMPNPVVSIKEINNAQARVRVKEQISRQ